MHSNSSTYLEHSNSSTGTYVPRMYLGSRGEVIPKDSVCCTVTDSVPEVHVLGASIEDQPPDWAPCHSYQYTMGDLIRPPSPGFRVTMNYVRVDVFSVKSRHAAFGPSASACLSGEWVYQLSVSSAAACDSRLAASAFPIEA